MLRCPNGEKTQPNRVKKELSLAVRLHPRLLDWFFANFPAFTHAQLLCVPSVLKRESILLTSPTGSGKTLAGFLGVFDSLLRELDSGGLKPRRALRLCFPTACTRLRHREKLARTDCRHGTGKGTPHSFADRRYHGNRAHQISQPAISLSRHYAESLAILLAQESYAQHLAKTEFVIVDELHSFAGNKRGADLSISLERLKC